MSRASQDGLRHLMLSQIIVFGESTSLLKPLVAMVTKLQAKGNAITIQETQDGSDSSTKKLDESRARSQIFALRPPRGICNGVLRGCWNFGAGTIGTPLVLIANTWDGLMAAGPKGCLVGLVSGVCWAMLFGLIGVVGTIQQPLLGVRNSLASPYYALNPRIEPKDWHLFQCSWVPYATTLISEDMYLKAQPSREDLETLARSRNTRHTKRGSTGNWGGSKGEPASSVADTSYYDILGVSTKATDKEIKAAYTKLAMELHPDRNKDSKNAGEQFHQVTKAYKCLSNPKKRKKYDTGGKACVENELALAKREGLRAVFGGDELLKLVGDVRLGRFSRRLIDDCFYLADEVEILNMYSRAANVQELLKYLEGFPSSSNSKEGSESMRNEEQKTSATSGGSKKPSPALRSPSSFSSTFSRGKKKTSSTMTQAEWEKKTNKKIQQAFLHTGLAREVLLIVGQEYLLAVQFYRSKHSLNHRLRQWWSRDVCHRWKTKRIQCQLLSFLVKSKKDRNNKVFLMNACWQLSVPELQATARCIAFRVLFDVKLRGGKEEENDEEMVRRAKALEALAQIFIKVGQTYQGANDQTLKKLQESMAAYQRGRKKDGTTD